MSSPLWTCQKNWLGCPLRLRRVLRDQKRPGYGPQHERNLTERTRLRKESPSQRSRSQISTGRLRHGLSPPSFRGLHLDEGPFPDLPPGSWQMDEGFQRSLRAGTSLCLMTTGKESFAHQEFNGSLTKVGAASVPPLLRVGTPGRPSRTPGSAPRPPPGHGGGPGKHDTPAFERLIPQ
ncbi:hypothetical protein GWK47_048592 [Chionoecetes opilio]|uniref:Uncharacterized protein n=1 Tax=Chionoecetes opilio TaxID=41210 RepID=A0A8J4YFI2_CHIOP|nr:hypothetical protein GWK47_048592 [Chionoecetes opilio]